MSAVNKAINILNEFWDGSLPVKLKSIADGIGVNIIPSFMIDDDPNISGKLSIKDDSPVCYVNVSDAKVRQRFTIAHELGHYVLGHGEMTDVRDTLYRNTSGYQDKLEREANAFAAELLMPKRAIDYLIDGEGITSVSELTDIFGVSYTAMEYRLKNIGWL